MDAFDVRLAKAAEAIARRSIEDQESQALKQLEHITKELEKHTGPEAYRVRQNLVMPPVVDVLTQHFNIHEAEHEDGDYYVLVPLSKGRVAPKPT